jgi:hypothetical protein
MDTPRLDEVPSRNLVMRMIPSGLIRIQFRIISPDAKQFAVRTAFHDAPLVHHEDADTAANGRPPVGVRLVAGIVLCTLLYHCCHAKKHVTSDII